MGAPVGLLNTQGAASYLAVSPRSLEAWRLTGEGPQYCRLTARAIRYRVEDLDAWAAERICRSTSDQGQRSAA